MAAPIAVPGGTLLDYAGDVAGIAEIIGLDQFAVLDASQASARDFAWLKCAL